MTERPCVSAVIVTFESREFIGASLDSLAKTARGFLKEVVVVDNASSDGSANTAQGHPLQPMVLSNPENIGFGRATNRGAAEISGEYLLILNPDCVAQPNMVAELVNFLDHRAPAGACGPMISSPDGEFQYGSRRGFPTPLNSLFYLLKLDRLFPRNRVLGGYQLRHLDPRLEMTAECLSGACMMVRRDVFQAIGGFDPDYFLFGEDIDLCWKIHASEREIWYVPSARATHIKGASMRSAPKRAQHEFYESMRLFVTKRLRQKYSPFALRIVKTGVDLAEAWARLRS